MQLVLFYGEAVVVFDMTVEELENLGERYRQNPSALTFTHGIPVIPHHSQHVRAHFAARRDTDML